MSVHPLPGRRFVATLTLAVAVTSVATSAQSATLLLSNAQQSHTSLDEKSASDSLTPYFNGSPVFAK
jgi:choline-glycine betaine transporter